MFLHIINVSEAGGRANTQSSSAGRERQRPYRRPGGPIRRIGIVAGPAAPKVMRAAASSTAGRGGSSCSEAAA